MYGFFKFFMFAGMAVTAIPFVTDPNKLAFLSGLPLPPNQACAVAGIVMIVVGLVGRQLSKPNSSGLV